MSISQAVLAVALWQTREFDTMQIAEAIGAKEADVCRAIHAAKEQVRSA